jgi:hypothetical protein
MESSDDNAANVVKDMAKLVLVAGKISDMHVKNMQMYPLIYFNGVKTVKIDYDLSHKADALVDKDNNLTINAPHRSNVVTYYLTMHEGAVNDKLDKRYAALTASIRTLFWKDVVVEVFMDEKIVYKSKK